MACYIRIGEEVDAEDLIEVPTERDGTLLLSSVSAQFPDAVGLRYKATSGAWRGVKVDGNIIDPPLEGWGDSEYYVVKKPLKRVANDDDGVGPGGKFSKMVEEDAPDLMIGGLPYSATDDEVKKYFESFGELDMCDIKHDREGKSRGFGFIRYKTVKAGEGALRGTHIINNRRVDVRYSHRSEQGQENIQDNIPTKLFVGRLPSGTTPAELQEYFSSYGVLKDIYIPNPFRGYGFVTFGSQTAAHKVLNDTHVLKGQFLNVGAPSEKKMDGQPNQGFNNMQGGGFGNMMGGGMQPNPGPNQMGNQQNNMSAGGNSTNYSWNPGNMQAQNGVPNSGPGYGYGYPGNYGNNLLTGKLGQNSVWSPKPLPKSK